jgi:hypothetical protein
MNLRGDPDPALLCPALEQACGATVTARNQSPIIDET